LRTNHGGHEENEGHKKQQIIFDVRVLRGHRDHRG
jgi:hypothetical protein